MNTTRKHQRRIDRVREVLRELDYAQRRLFELRTGVPTRESRRRREVRMLESQFAGGGRS